MEPIYTKDWFSNNIPVWKRYLRTVEGHPNLKALEIGSYEGRSARWLLENILKHPTCRMICVDNFDVNNKDLVHRRFLSNMTPFRSKYKLYKGNSSDVLKQPRVVNERFDIIYIDANHHSRHVLEDMVLCFPLLKEDGIMIIDDYTDNKEHNNNCPKPAVNAFLNAYANEIKVMHIGWQVLLKKRKIPLRRKLCFSEYFTEPVQASSMRHY